jgi:predicted N-acetyltransferase YhbS
VEAVIRQMTQADLPAADELRRLAGWNQTPEDWRVLLSFEPNGCFVAVPEGTVVGTVTTTTYGRTLAWIGMMLVHPDYQRRGIATRLMQRSLEYLRGCGVGCVKLDATPVGRPVYEKLGFVAESALTRYQRPAGAQVRLENPGARPLIDEDWAAVDAIDGRGFGVSRLRVLRELGKCSLAALVWPADGAISGFGMLRRGANAVYLGPIVCGSEEGSGSLIGALLHLARGRPVFWDVPASNEKAKRAAERFGFAPLRPLTRMRLGPDVVHCDFQSQFAIADPSVG